MDCTVLIENSPGIPGLISEHGLSILIETERHRLLSDTGATDAFIKNAALLHKDLSSVDTVILSHGHYDHCGGVLPFFRINPAAEIYIQKNAFGAFFNGEGNDIGIDKSILSLPSLHLLNGSYHIDEELFLFSGVHGRRLFPSSNRRILKAKHGMRVQDDFLHEQYLVISEKEKLVLVSGCAHNGILNILDHFRALYGKDPDAVISGFHMMKKSAYTEEDRDLVLQTAKELLQTKTVYYTGHCTGTEAADILKDCLHDQIRFLHTGMQLSSSTMFL